MNKHKRLRPAWLLLALIVSVTVSGCGSGLLTTRGRVLKGGAPFLPGPGEFVRVTFVPILEGGKTPQDYYVAEYNASDGTFQVAGKDRKGMPPGKYRVAIELDRHRNDLLQGRFDADRSPFVFEVDQKTSEVMIDLDKPPQR